MSPGGRALLLLGALAWAACATGGRTAADGGGTTTEGVDAAPAPSRPLPQPVEPPAPFRRAIENGTRTTTGEPGPRYWQQWTEYDLDARLLTGEKRLEGTARIVYHNRSPDALERIHLALYQNLHAPGAMRLEPVEVTGGVELERVALDGRALTPGGDGPRYVVDGTVLTLVPPAPLAPGGTATIEVAWAFDVPRVGAGGRMGTSEDLFFLAYWYPIVRVYDDVQGWDLDQFLSQAEFYAGFGRYDVTIEAPAEWLLIATGEIQNAGDALSDSVQARIHAAGRSDSLVRIVTPENFGRLATAEEAGETIRWHFVADSVHDVAFSATRASNWDATRTPVGDRDGDGRTDYALVNALWRSNAPLWSEVARYERHAIAFLSEFTGTPYPWPHMTAVEGGGIIGGGMEFPMMTLIGDYNERGDSALYYVTAHELGHMWVPMIVSTNERRYAWMDEGLTTFNENMARMDFFPGSDHHAADRADYLEIAGTEAEGEMMRWSDWHVPGEAYGVASYDKPATALVALRAVLGAETFDRAYRTWFDRWAFRHAYPWDFFNTFEDVSGRDLDWFWHAWFYETWTLDQAVAEVTPTPAGTTIVIDDRGRVPMPVPLEVECADGRTLAPTVPVDPWLEGRTRTTLTVDCEATAVTIDPGHAYPDADRSDNAWRR